MKDLDWKFLVYGLEFEVVEIEVGINLRFKIFLFFENVVVFGLRWNDVVLKFLLFLLLLL